MKNTGRMLRSFGIWRCEIKNFFWINIGHSALEYETTTQSQTLDTKHLMTRYLVHYNEDQMTVTKALNLLKLGEFDV